MTDNKRFIYLLQGYLEQTSSTAELQEFAEMIAQMDDQLLSQLVGDNWTNHHALHTLKETEAQSLLAQILQKQQPAIEVVNTTDSDNDKEAKSGHTNQDEPQPKHQPEALPNEISGQKKRFTLRSLLPYAAIFIGVLITLGALFISGIFPGQDNSTNEITAFHQIIKSDVPPGTNGAVLTLANGKQVVLDSALTSQRQLLNDATTAIVKLKPGGIEYDGVQVAKNATTQYNTLSTPASRTFHVKLPDGTEVWLNAASSIRYPIVFNKQSRAVTITGEAYFEVAKLQRPGGKGRVPFIVQIQTGHPGQPPSRIEVLGTHFNINAYADDGKIKTTLLEGKVNVYAANSQQATAILPGDQAIMRTTANSPVEVQKVDVQKAIAWKNGFFDFDQAGLKEVMEQIGRWYNVEVVYPVKLPERKFWGKIQRSLYLSQVLSVLEQVDIHFTIDKNKLIVAP